MAEFIAVLPVFALIELSAGLGYTTMEEYLHNFKEIEKGRGPSPLNPMECGISAVIRPISSAVL